MITFALSNAHEAFGDSQARQRPGSDVDVPRDFNRRLSELEARVDRLQCRDQVPWLDEARTHEIRALVENMLVDADQRASLLVSKPLAGYEHGHGFFLNSADDAFHLEFSGELQTRYVFNHQNNSPTDDSMGGFDIRRLHLAVDGHLITPKLRYSVSMQTQIDGGEFLLLDSWTAYDFSDELALKIGQFRPPFLKEHAVSNKRQLLADRSLIAQRYDPGYDQGIEVDYDQSAARFRAALTDVHPGLDDKLWAVSARGELRLAGEWRRLRDMSSWPNEKPSLALGTGFHVRMDDDLLDHWAWTVDLSAEGHGRSVIVEFIQNQIDNPPHRTQRGVVVQGGWIVWDSWEVVARYEWGDADQGGDDLSVITVGINKYFAKHDLKWNTDLGYGFNPVNSIWSSRLLGWRTDSPGEDGQVVLRSQFQLLF